MLTFTTDPVDRSIHLAGPMSARLALASTAPTMHACLKLVDVDPTGTAIRIAEGACFVREPRPEEPVTVDLGHTAYRLEPFHRLRLEVASSSFPRLILHPGTQESPWRATHMQPNEQTLAVGGTSPSRLLLTLWDAPVPGEQA